jgi:hypothetical protein
MAAITDFTVNGRLQCGAQTHPQGWSRDTMFFLVEKDGFFVFGCKVCTELQRRPQIHVIARCQKAVPIYKNTRKAEKIDRDHRGQITSFR